MADEDGIDGLSRRLDELEAGFVSSGQMAAAFGDELTGMRQSMLYTGREVDTLSSSIGRTLKRAFEDLAYNGESLSDVLTEAADAISKAAYNVAVQPVTQAVGSTVASGLNSVLSGAMSLVTGGSSDEVSAFALGGAFQGGRVVPFASGGVVSSPVSFPLRGATGLMGEAGAEAILPLSRGSDGRLGVQSAGSGRSVNVVMNVTTPDTTSFAKSQSQIAQQINRALSRGQRNA